MFTRAVLSMLLLAVAAPVIGRPMETPNGPSTIQDMRRDMRTWKGQLVAMRGRVLTVSAAEKGQPLVQLALGEQPNSQTVWVASMVSGKFSKGDDVVMLGLMTRVATAAESPTLARVVTDPFMVLGLCVINLSANWGAEEQTYRGLCEQWRTKGMPRTPQ